MEGTSLPAITFSSFRSPLLPSSITGVSAPHSSRRLTSVQSKFNATNYDAHRHSRTSAKYWDKFYHRHQNKFFKDRHYLSRIGGTISQMKIHFPLMERLVVELVIPFFLLSRDTLNYLYMPVISRPMRLHSLNIFPVEMHSHTTFTEDKINAFVCNVAEDNLCDYVMPSSVDAVTLIFMLSAVSPEKMPFMIHNLKKVLKPNGCILLRDYAIGDFAQVKLQSRDQMISENFFFRGDGTSSFYFSEDFLSTLFMRAGFTVVDMNTYYIEIENRSRNIVMPRRWIRAVFRML